MKICVISTPVFAVKDQGLTGYGGLEQIAWHCAEQLAKQGNEVALVAPEGSTCPNVQVITNGKPGTWNERTAFNSYHEELNKFDVIIDHTWMKYSYLKKGKGDLKAPILGVLHAPINTMYQTLPPNVENPCFVAISSDQSRHFEVLFNRRAEVCWNGIDTSFYKNIGLPRTDRYLFLARFSTIKGPHIAIDVCKNTKTKLDLIGDTQITGEPEYLKKCQDAILGYPDIQFLGGKNRGECVWYFSQAKALLHPNKLFREPFGLAPVEAMACFPAETPVRATNIQRTFSLTYSGILLQLTTDYGAIECTPEHPFMTQRGWVAAKDLTLVDSLTKVHHGRNKMDEIRIGNLVQELSDQGNSSSSPVFEQIQEFGQIQGKETWITQERETTIHQERGENSQRNISRKGIIDSSKSFGANAARHQEESNISRDTIQIRQCRFQRCGDRTYQETLSNQGFKNDDNVTGEDTGKCSCQSSNTWNKEDIAELLQTSSNHNDIGGNSLSSRDNRWRRDDSTHQRSEEKNISSSDTNIQHISTDNTVDQEQTSLSKCNNQPTSWDERAGVCQGKKTQFLDHFFKGVQVTSLLQSIVETHDNQTPPTGNSIGICQNSIKSMETSKENEKDETFEKNAPIYELTRIRSITGREVKNLPVYNLGTSTGDYEASGYLVHNCGTPVIAWKYGAMGETVIHGTTGFLVETQNQIESIIKEDLVSTIKPEHCREHVERFFTIQRMGHRYQELCQMAIEEEW